MAGGPPAARDLEPGGLLAVVARGTLEVEGRLVNASNTTVRCFATLDGATVRCVYKPVAGERPLWDFPDGTLAGREVSAYLLSAATGWDLVPPTVLRDGPLGPGACQLWIEDEAEPLVGFVPEAEVPPGWHRVAAAEDTSGRRYALAHAEDVRLARMAVFDAVANNADRKAGHVLVTPDGRLYGVDHGVCFHVESKLRTVLWGWAEQPLPDGTDEVLGEVAAGLRGPLGAALAEHLTRQEVSAVADRVTALRRRGRFPAAHPHRPSIPWPPV